MQSEAGAIAFVNHYFAQVNTAWMTPDPSLLPPLAEAGCKSCDGFEAAAQELHDGNVRFDSAPVTVLAVMALPDSTREQVRLGAQLRQNRANEVDRNGNVVKPHPLSEFAQTIVVVWQEGRWLLYGMA